MAFEADDIDPASKTGWPVMIQGGTRHVEDEDRRAELLQAGIDSWAGGAKSLFMRMTPALVTGRRIRQADPEGRG